MHGINVAEHALTHHVHDLDVSRIEEALLAGEEDEARLQVLAVDGQRLLHRVGDGLLAVNMFACVESIHSDLIVRVQRRSDDDAVDALVFQQLVVVGVGLGQRHHFQCGIERRLIDVGESHHLAFGVLRQELQQEASPRAGSDHAEPATFMGAIVHRRKG